MTLEDRASALREHQGMCEMYFYHQLNAVDILADVEKELTTAEDVFVLFVGEESSNQLPMLMDALNGADVPYIGGVFPGLIFQNEHFTAGVVMTKVRGLYPRSFKHYTLDEHDPFANEENLMAMLEQAPHRPTTLVLVDGLAANVESFLAKLFGHFGNTLRYLGGGAGSLSLQQSPCVFSPEGLFENQAIVLFTEERSHLGVQHGWEDLAGPFLASRTDGNIIYELNWQNAYTVYKEAVNAVSPVVMQEENFFSVAKQFPFGIFKSGVEKIVRDPIQVNEDGSLTCVGQVPQNTVLYILQGKPERLIAYAGHATKKAKEAVAGTTVLQCLIMDCISRVLFLEQGFDQELIAIREELQEPDVVACGALTLGEISSYETGRLEFFNKTVVVGLFYG